MRAAFVTSDVLSASGDGRDQLRSLFSAGLTVMVLRSQPAVEGEDDDPARYGYPVLECRPSDVFCRDDLPDLLVQAASAADVSLSEAFLVCRQRDDVALAIAAGCRPVVVLGERTMDEFLGPQEPDEKGFVTAPDLETAAEYMIEEMEQEAALGAFPYGPHHGLEEIARPPMMRRSDVLRIMAVVITAGVAIALGIAYLLQELYQTYHFPPIAHWLTLQFIPQVWRGILFLLIGVAATLVAQRFINRVTGRRRAG